MLVAACGTIAFAQSSDKAKPEFFAGFSVDSIDTGIDSSGVFVRNGDNRQTAYGFETSVTGYFTRRFGIEGNVDGHYKTKTFDVSATATGPIVPIEVKIAGYNFMGGPHLRFPSDDSKVVPFVHALFGGNHTRLRGTGLGVTVNDSETDFAMKFGGGIDFGVSDHVGVRVAADYNPVLERNSGGATSDNRTRHDAVFSVGLVFK